ncbi:NADP-dependent oxidoreductase domain-containing protein [Gongronella butleri]|nr:NADP-dependent oxidoreductase domain-containing protein [Gongronella butleri]
MASEVPIIKLNNSLDFPAIGLGTWKGNSSDEELAKSVTLALDAGYRHIDTAYVYRTEVAVGKAVREHPTVKREDVTVVTKLWQSHHAPEHVPQALEHSLKNLGLDYVDGFLIHWPQAWKFRGFEFDQLTVHEDDDVPCIDIDYLDTWRAMEKLLEGGRVKTIGVSNFTIPMLERLLENCTIPPAINEIEVHPSLPNTELVEFCQKKGIAVCAYCPLANPDVYGKMSVLDDPRTAEIAKKYDLTPGQLLLNWGVARGYAVIPKSVTPSRIVQNIKTVKLEKEDVDKITAIGAENPRRVCPSPDLKGTSDRAVLNNGQSFPAIGLGTWKGNSSEEEVAKAVTEALNAGYRHIDTAYVYETEVAVGKAVRKHASSAQDRAIVVSKLTQSHHHPDHVPLAFEHTLRNLGFDHLNIFLMHWPFAWQFRGFAFDQLVVHNEDGDIPWVDVDFVDTWRAMEELVKKDGRVKTIGVSNFTIPMLERLLANCSIPPAINEIEVHPSHPNIELVEYCQKKGIVVVAYCPLGNPAVYGKFSVLEDPRTAAIAEKYSLTPAQLILSWGVSRGYAVIPKSVTPSRIQENIKTATLTKEDIDAITAIGAENPRRLCSPLKKFGPSNNIFDEPLDG